MDIVLVHGLWLNGSSWDGVVPALEQAGHRVQALTLPGMDSRQTDRSGITARDHVDAIVAAIDAAIERPSSSAGQPVLLVGHSVGCGLGSAAVDVRPDRVARAVYVGGFPAVDGAALLPGLPAENGEVAMPDWVAMGEEANVVDFDPESLAHFYDAAIPAPERVLTDPLTLSDQRRYDVPVLAVCPEYTAADRREWIDDGEGSVAEFARIRDVEFVDLPGGHWPQLRQPDALARIILDAAQAG